MPTVKPVFLNESGQPDLSRSFLSLSISGRLGSSGFYGFNDLGRSEYGQLQVLAGTYRKAWTGYNNRGVIANRPRTRYFVQMRDCTPHNPNSVNQQARRLLFKNAMGAWQALTEPQKNVWRAKAVKKSRYGHHLFIKWYMSQNG